MSKSINKQKIITNLRNHKIDDFSEQIINGKIIYNIILGDKMTKVSKIDLILQEMREGFNQVNTRLDTLEKDVSILKKDVWILKKDVSQLKREAIKHGWDID